MLISTVSMETPLQQLVIHKLPIGLSGNVYYTLRFSFPQAPRVMFALAVFQPPFVRVFITVLLNPIYVNEL